MLRDRRVVTSPERLTHAFAEYGPMRMLLETGTESEWVAQALEAAGHTVIVADPIYAPMYGEGRESPCSPWDAHRTEKVTSALGLRRRRAAAGAAGS